MTPTQLIDLYPALYHMAMDGSWPSIQRHGLLSTTALLDLFEINGSDRKPIETARRPNCVTIQHRTHGHAVIRDNIPLRDGALLKCLEGMSPPQWYNLLNQRVFFWPTEERLKRLLAARAYRGSGHCVITVSTEALIRQHADRIRVSPINSGSTIYNAPKRGAETFQSVDKYPLERWIAKRGRKGAIAEVAILGGIVDIQDIALRVERRQDDRVISVLWESPKKLRRG
jgi:hypothetical protein